MLAVLTATLYSINFAITLNVESFTDRKWQGNIWARNQAYEYYWVGVYTSTDTSLHNASMQGVREVSFT